MTEHLAKLIAEELGAVAEHTGGNLWAVVFARPDGRVAVLSEDGASEYVDLRAWRDHAEETAFVSFV